MIICCNIECSTELKYNKKQLKTHEHTMILQLNSRTVQYL
jgi:hypothetical protein